MKRAQVELVRLFQRFNLAGAIYHVTACGNAGAPIFLDDEDQQLFLGVLAERVKRFDWLCHAYCLMDNHYHLLTETPESNLSAGMRSLLNGIYIQRFSQLATEQNVFQGKVQGHPGGAGKLFAGTMPLRGAEAVRAGMAPSVGQYEWSSYPMIGASPAPPHFIWIGY
jgi:REP element-mobilizing transposase RayT